MSAVPQAAILSKRTCLIVSRTEHWFVAACVSEAMKTLKLNAMTPAATVKMRELNTVSVDTGVSEL